MKIKCIHTTSTYAWGPTPAGFFAPGMVREVPPNREADVTRDLTKREAGGRGRLLGLFVVVDDSTPTSDPKPIPERGDMSSDKEVRAPRKGDKADKPPPPPRLVK